MTGEGEEEDVVEVRGVHGQAVHLDRFLVEPLNGRPGILGIADEQLLGAMVLDVADDRVVAVRTVANPDKLTYLAAGRAHLRRVFDRVGIEVHTGALVSRVRHGAVVLADGRTIGAGLAVWATGFVVPPHASQAGLAGDGHGRILVEDTLRSVSHSDIYAVGDSAAARRTDGQELRMACATGLPSGQCAADAITARLTGREPRPLRFRYVLQCMSLGRRDGLIQFVHPDDSPREMVLTGRAAARFKELVVRGARWATQR